MKTEKIDLYCLGYIGATEQDYLKVVSNYIVYYQEHAKIYKVQYYALSCFKIIILLLVPAMHMISLFSSSSYIATLSSSTCLAIEAIMSLFHMKEKWILYRNTNNALLSEQRQFASASGKYYEVEERFRMFVLNVENIIDAEAREWNETVKTQREGIETSPQKHKKNSE